MTEFDPGQHRMVSEQRWFEDFVLGERFVIPSRTMMTAVFEVSHPADCLTVNRSTDDWKPALHDDE
jgi:hypothetical protein